MTKTCYSQEKAICAKLFSDGHKMFRSFFLLIFGRSFFVASFNKFNQNADNLLSRFFLSFLCENTPSTLLFDKELFDSNNQLEESILLGQKSGLASFKQDTLDT